jgi:segregation and condensation protein A
LVEPSLRPTVLASSFAATLELVREGRLEMHQHAAFAPLFVRARANEGQDGGATPDLGNA